MNMDTHRHTFGLLVQFEPDAPATLGAPPQMLVFQSLSPHRQRSLELVTTRLPAGERETARKFFNLQLVGYCLMFSKGSGAGRADPASISDNHPDPP